jgi:hypothetical protein
MLALKYKFWRENSNFSQKIAKYFQKNWFLPTFLRGTPKIQHQLLMLS